MTMREGHRGLQGLRLAVFLLAALAIVVFAVPGPTMTLADNGAAVGPKLTPKLRQLLKVEMTEIMKSTGEITRAVATGDHATIEKEATAVADGFILKRSLTEQDRKDLKGAVPTAFLKLDTTFHRTAAKLALAAKSRNPELEGFYLSKMLGYCVSCHTSYAANRFDGFKK